MKAPRKQSGVGGLLYLMGLLGAGAYFTFAAVQGDYGLFRRVRIEAEISDLNTQKARLAAEIAQLENRSHRISDDFLDLDLLDEQARQILGAVRADEIILR